MLNSPLPLGINIPHYCYHKGLSITGNCRMCFLELKNSPKPAVSCAMNAKSCLVNSDIYTNSSLVKKARENILEFLLPFLFISLKNGKLSVNYFVFN